MADVEKASSPDATHPTDQHASRHKHGDHRSGRLHRLLHPSGRIFHVVLSPHEVEPKRRAILDEDPKASDFDVVVHGTDEHINAVRDCHLHHAKSRDELYASNGDILSHYEGVRTQLDALSRELQDLTDHAVSMDASFEKWGYSARIRTHGDSDLSSLDSNSTHDASSHQDRTMTAMKFFKAPVVRQYFHRGLLWRSPLSSEVVSFELFVDLVYVAVIDAIGEVAVLHPTAASFLHYIIVFSIASKVFLDILLVMNWFEINDIFGRLCVLFILVCLYAFSSNVEYFFEGTYTAGLSFYLASRFMVMIWYCFAAILIPMVRPILFWHAFLALLAAVIWIGSIHVEYPNSLGLIWAATFVDMFGGQVFWPFVRNIGFRNRSNKWLDKMTEYLPGINIEHRVERTGAFVSLVIGYSVIKIFFQNHSDYPMNAFLGKGILGLIQAFTFNWIYFEIDASSVDVHAIRRHWFSTGVWNTMHIPFSAAFILAASTLSELVIAHDCSDADPETLAEPYSATSLGEIEPALRWFYCGGLGVALISMAIISLCHQHKQLPNAKLRKPVRIAYRVAVAITIICLPLAEHLTSLDLIAITTCLTVSILTVDIFGLSCAGDGFFKNPFCPIRKRQTQYTAKCNLSKKKKMEMREAVERGEKIDLAEVLRRDNSVSSLESAETAVYDRHGFSAVSG